MQLLSKRTRAAHTPGREMRVGLLGSCFTAALAALSLPAMAGTVFLAAGGAPAEI